MGNHEENFMTEDVHLFIALERSKYSNCNRCMRQVIYDTLHEENELELLKVRCKQKGGVWRIHKTVNARSVEKAFKFFLHGLIDHPERKQKIESFWRTALLQQSSRAERKFMFDIDFENTTEIKKFMLEKGAILLEEHKTPRGWHIITEPFDTRGIENFKDVTKLVDGFYYVETIGEKNG